MPKYLTNTTFFNDALGTYIADGQITTKKITTNGDIVFTGSLINGSNNITFDDTYSYTNFNQNTHFYGTSYIDFGGSSYDIGSLLSQYSAGIGVSPYPSITYDSQTEETSFTGTLVFETNAIQSEAIQNNTFMTYSQNENITGVKSFSETQVFSSLRLNSDLIVNAGGTTISNSQLQLIPNISTNTTNIATNTTDINDLKTKTTAISYAPNTLTTTFINNVSFPSIRLDGSLLLSNGTITITNAQLQDIQSIAIILPKVQNITANASSTTISNQTNLANVDFTGNINTFSKANFDNTITQCATLSSPAQTQLDTLNTKAQYITSSINNTNIGYTTNLTDLNFSGTINAFSKGDFNNVITQCASLGANCQNQINSVSQSAGNAQNTANTAINKADGAQGTATSALALAGTATATAGTALGVAGTALTGANTANSGLATLNTTVDGIEVDVAELQVKCTQISYNSGTSRTTISQTLNSPFLEIGDLTSGFTQTQNSPIKIIGLLTCDNAVNINGTLYLENNNSMIIEGIINQNTGNAGTNLFQAPTTFFGNVIMSGANATINATTTQIGTSAVSNFNCNSTATFGGDITMSIDKKLTLKNIVPILLDSIYFGGEAGGYLDDDVVFNMKIEANRPVAINNTFQVGTTINRNTLTAYNTTTLLDANTSITLNSPIINVTGPYVAIGQSFGFNYLFGTTFVQNLYSSSGIVGMAGQVFQQF